MSIKRQNDKAFGPDTVVKNGISYPNAYWAKIEVVPVKNPKYKPGSKVSEWIHPDRLASKETTSKSIREGMNTVTDVPKYAKMGYHDGKLLYDMSESAYNPFTGGVVKTGNAWDRTKSGLIAAGAYALGRLINGDFIDDPDYDKRYRISDNPQKRSSNPTLWYPKNNTPENRRKDVSDYLDRTWKKTFGDGNKRKLLTESLARTMKKFTTAQGRASLRASMLGTAEGIADGIVSSDIGQAAIRAGRSAYNTVAKGVKNALKSIKNFFNPNKEKRNYYFTNMETGEQLHGITKSEYDNLMKLYEDNKMSELQDAMDELKGEDGVKATWDDSIKKYRPSSATAV